MGRAPKRGRGAFGRLGLGGPVPTRLIHHPNGAERADPSLTALALGLADAGALEETLTASPAVDHAFAWLPVLATDPDGLRAARALLSGWMMRAGGAAVWAAGPTAKRAEALLLHLPALVERQDAPFREALLDLLARHARRLSQLEKRTDRTGSPPLAPLIVRSLLALCLPEDPRGGMPITDGLVRALTAVAEGRLPAQWSDASRLAADAHRLRLLKEAFSARQLSGPQALEDASKTAHLCLGGRLASPDGLALLPQDAPLDPSLLRRLSPPRRGEAAILLEALGIARIEEAGLIIWADVREASGGALTIADDAGPIITNCGQPSAIAAALSPRWRQWADALSHPAARSAWSAAPSSSGRVVRRETVAEGALAELVFGAGPSRYERRLFASAEAPSVRGEETLVSRSEEPGIVRFHLPPEATLSLENESRCRIDRPEGPSYSLHTREAYFEVDESVQIIWNGGPTKTAQALLTTPGSSLKWALNRL